MSQNKIEAEEIVCNYGLATVFFWSELVAGTVPSSKNLVDGTVASSKNLVDGTPKKMAKFEFKFQQLARQL